MGLHKICKHKGRARDRCKHAWWGSFRGKRVSLAKWTNREITSKAEIEIRDGIPVFCMPPDAPVLTSADVDRLLHSDLHQ